MAKVTPVDFDPFGGKADFTGVSTSVASTEQPRAPKKKKGEVAITPVDFDPFTADPATGLFPSANEDLIAANPVVTRTVVDPLAKALSIATPEQDAAALRFDVPMDPKFKDNEIAVKVGRSNTGRIYTTVRVIGSAIDIRRYVACGTDGEKVEELSISHRVEVVNTGEIMDASEAVLIKLEDLETML